MGLKKLASFYSIFMGICIIGMWSVFLNTGGVPELQTRPYEIFLHITAEFLTALSLIFGGFGLLRDHMWGFQTYLLSIGMFGTFFATALAFIILTFTHREKFHSCK